MNKKVYIVSNKLVKSFSFIKIEHLNAYSITINDVHLGYIHDEKTVKEISNKILEGSKDCSIEIDFENEQEKTITDKIISWAKERNLHSADVSKQFIKLIEEVGELADGLNKYNYNAIVDSIGDIYVVLTILSMQLGLDIRDCIAIAYEEIKDRKGKTINGVFIKESDLHE